MKRFRRGESVPDTHAVEPRPILDIMKDQLSSDQLETTDRFTRMFEWGIVELARRSEGNPDLMLAMDGFLRAFDMRAGFGWNDENLGPSQQEDLTVFFNAVANRLSGRLPDGSNYTGWTILPIDETRI